LKKLPTDKNFLAVLLMYSVSIFIEWFVVFTSVSSNPGLYDPNSTTWSFYPPSVKPTRFYFFGFERTIVLLLHPTSVVAAWIAWQFLGYTAVSYAFIPHHKGSISARLAPKFFKERPNQRYFIAGGSSHGKNLKSIVKASTLPFSLLLSISILLMKNMLITFVKPKPFSTTIMILMPCTIFINFTLYVVLSLLAFITPSIWILEGTGLRYYDPDKKTIVEVVADYKGAIHGLSGLAAATSFLSLLYDVMIDYGLGFDYVLSYLFFTIFFLYPSTLLVTALYIHFSEAQSIEKLLKKMRSDGFSLPQVPSIDYI